jgi:hypothetical protein
MVAFRSYVIQKTGWKERPLRVSERLFNYTCCRFRLPAGLVTATFNPLLSNEPLDHANDALSTVFLPGLLFCAMRC